MIRSDLKLREINHAAQIVQVTYKHEGQLDLINIAIDWFLAQPPEHQTPC